MLRWHIFVYNDRTALVLLVCVVCVSRHLSLQMEQDWEKSNELFYFYKHFIPFTV